MPGERLIDLFNRFVADAVELFKGTCRLAREPCALLIPASSSARGHACRETEVSRASPSMRRRVALSSELLARRPLDILRASAFLEADDRLQLMDHDLDRLLERLARSDGAVGLDKDAQAVEVVRSPTRMFSTS